MKAPTIYAGLIGLCGLLSVGVFVLLDREQQIRDLQQAQERQTAAQQQIRQLQQLLPARAELLQGESPAIAGEALRALVKEQVADAGAQISQSTVSYGATVVGYRVIQLSAALDGPVESVLTSLAALETTPIRLYVATVDIHRTEASAPAGLQAAKSSLQVHGYWQGSASEIADTGPSQ